MRPTTSTRPTSAMTVAAQGAACWPMFIDPPKSALSVIKYQIEMQEGQEAGRKQFFQVIAAVEGGARGGGGGGGGGGRVLQS